MRDRRSSQASIFSRYRSSIITSQEAKPVEKIDLRRLSLIVICEKDSCSSKTKITLVSY